MPKALVLCSLVLWTIALSSGEDAMANYLSERYEFQNMGSETTMRSALIRPDWIIERAFNDPNYGTDSTLKVRLKEDNTVQILGNRKRTSYLSPLQNLIRHFRGDFFKAEGYNSSMAVAEDSRLFGYWKMDYFAKSKGQLRIILNSNNSSTIHQIPLVSSPLHPFSFKPKEGVIIKSGFPLWKFWTHKTIGKFSMQVTSNRLLTNGEFLAFN